MGSSLISPGIVSIISGDFPGISSAISIRILSDILSDFPPEINQVISPDYLMGFPGIVLKFSVPISPLGFLYKYLLNFHQGFLPEIIQRSWDFFVDFY